MPPPPIDYTIVISKISDVERVVSGVMPEVTRLSAELSVVKVMAGHTESKLRETTGTVKQLDTAVYRGNGKSIVSRLDTVEIDSRNAHIRVNHLKGESDRIHRIVDENALALVDHEKEIQTIKNDFKNLTESKKERLATWLTVGALVLNFLLGIGSLWMAYLALKR